jgi:intracellular septation protein
MKLLFDFLPGLFFLVALFLFDIYTATAVVMIAMTLQVAGLLVLRRKVSGMQWMTLGVILLFGGATLVLRDPTFIKWKPTILNWMFAGVLLASPLWGKNFIRVLMEEHFKLPDRLWGRLNIAWAVFLALVGGLNLFVAYNFSERAWGSFKVFGITGLFFAFSLAQAFYLARHDEEAQRAAP